jgi:hypothetical protein
MKRTVDLQHAFFAAKKVSGNRKLSGAEGVVEVRRIGPGQHDFAVFIIDPAKHPQGPGGVLVTQFRRGRQS